jgi:hypothetical protein
MTWRNRCPRMVRFRPSSEDLKQDFTIQVHLVGSSHIWNKFKSGWTNSESLKELSMPREQVTVTLGRRRDRCTRNTSYTISNTGFLSRPPKILRKVWKSFPVKRKKEQVADFNQNGRSTKC